MNLSEHQDTFRVIGITAAVFLLIGLGGWYLFLSQNTSTIESVGESRGFSVGIPSFSGSRGSAIENLAQGLARSGEETTATSSGKRPPRLWQINKTPVAGAGFVVNGSSTIVRFVERSSGYVFDANPETSEVIRLTNTSLGTVYDAQIGSKETLLLRTLDDVGAVHTHIATFGTTTEGGLHDLETTDVGSTHAIAFRDDIPLLLVGENGSRLVASSTKKQETLFSSPLQGWRIVRTHPLVVMERPGSSVLGSAFTVGSQGRFEKITTGRGLTLATHPESDAHLIGEEGDAMRLFAQLPGSTTRTSLDIRTVADKCAWAPGRSFTAYCAAPQGDIPSNFLDAWYRGTVHTQDHWFTVEASSGTVESLFAPGSDIELDVEYPRVDQSARYILFMNARDKSLWLLRTLE